VKTIERIIIDPGTCHGKPTIRGTRIMVSNILSLLAGGYSADKILEYYPDLKAEDVTAAIEYAVAVIDEETILTRST
jgi:uncharacterized protein (DUF433 family)